MSRVRVRSPLVGCGADLMRLHPNATCSIPEDMGTLVPVPMEKSSPIHVSTGPGESLKCPVLVCPQMLLQVLVEGKTLSAEFSEGWRPRSQPSEEASKPMKAPCRTVVRNVHVPEPETLGSLSLLSFS